jgi:kojibiose phosphorylase
MARSSTSIDRPELIQPILADRFDSLQARLRRTSDPMWLLCEEGFTLAREHEVESLFAIANGYIGNRASLAEGSPLSAPATFAAGVFTRPLSPNPVPELMILPDWSGVRVFVEGDPLNMNDGEVLEHRRILDMHQGVLWREWRHRDPNGRVTHLIALRLVSQADRHLLLQSVLLKAENYSGTVQLESSIEVPPDLEPFSPPDWKARRGGERPNVLPLAFRTRTGNYSIAFAVAGQLLSSGRISAKREISIDERRVVERFETLSEPGAEYELLRVVSVFTSRDGYEPPQTALAHANHVFAAGFTNAAAMHAAAWEGRWETADIQIEGDHALQCALRFSIYHLISAANPEDPRVSI